MVGIIVATHGGFANGILQSAGMVFDSQEDVIACPLMPEEGPNDLKNKMLKAIDSFKNKDEVLFLVDLWSGSPFNQASMLVEEHKDKWALVSGLNLPMLVEALSLRMDGENAHSIAKQIVLSSRDEIKALPEGLLPEMAQGGASQAVQQGSIPPGTVIGDGKIKYLLVRVDTRLLHGQVATGWVKALKPNRIIVVSDNVSKDKLRKNMIEQASPPGVKAHVVPLKKMVEIQKDTRFGNTKAIILFETMEEALAAHKAGIKFDSLNLGSIAHSVGKVVVTNVLAMDMNDVNAIKNLMKDGVSMDVRKVPADSPVKIENIINKAENELKNSKGEI